MRLNEPVVNGHWMYTCTDLSLYEEVPVANELRGLMISRTT